jgi:hypothetical protein
MGKYRIHNTIHLLYSFVKKIHKTPALAIKNRTAQIKRRSYKITKIHNNNR